MTQPHKIVLVGFSSFEKVTFESFFRLAARRPPGYVLVNDASEAALAVVNADDAAALRQSIAAKPCEKVLLVGSQDGGTGWTLQRRPLNLMKVLSTVESLLSPSTATVPSALPRRPEPPQAATKPAPIASPSGISTLSKPAAATAALANPSSDASAKAPVTVPGASAPLSPELRKSVRSGFGKSSFSSNSADPMAGFAGSSNTTTRSMELDHILVVDDSDIALKFMRNRLSRFGFHADLANSGEEALGKMNARPYKFVFLDVMMEGLDGYQTCRAIKQRKYSTGKPPVVVMLTSRGGTIDKIRGTLAGCDAYLTKPLNERDLIAVLAKHDSTVARSFQETNFGGASSGFTKSVK